jgi:hypothetical protein
MHSEILYLMPKVLVYFDEIHQGNFVQEKESNSLETRQKTAKAKSCSKYIIYYIKIVRLYKLSSCLSLNLLIHFSRCAGFDPSIIFSLQNCPITYTKIECF